MTITLTPQAARVYEYINSVCKAGDKVPRLSVIERETLIPGTTICKCLARMSGKGCGLLRHAWTEDAPIISVYYLVMPHATYDLCKRRSSRNSNAAPVVLPEPVHPRRALTEWEKALEWGY